MSIGVEKGASEVDSGGIVDVGVGRKSNSA